MKLHLPVRLFKSVLACLAAVASFSLGSGVAWAEAQNLTFSGSSLTWDTSTENKSFVDEEDAAASFAAGDNVSFTGESTVTLGENITAGTLDIAAGADVTIDLGNYTLNADAISLSGTLNVGDSLSIASGSTLAVKNAAAVLDSALVLGEKSGLVVESAASLNNNSLTLQGGSNLILTADSDGKTYTLFSGISSLVDKNGNTLTAGSYSINDYFDKDAPGSGFWADATLVYTADGSLQIVRHNETVKAPLEITESKTGPQDYNYYKSISFLDCSIYSADGDNIELNNNGSVTFSGNTASSDRAIFVSVGGTIMLSNNGSVEFSGYTASSGGAILGYGTDSTELSNNGSVTFKENMAFSTSSDALGGAICGSFSTIELNNNGRVEFCGNKTSSSSYHAHGGAIYGDRDIDMAHNGSVWFSGNEATSSTACGGAIYSVAGGCSLLYNDIVSFRGNKASSTSSTACGGAIYGANGTSVTLRYNGSVEFSGNTASTDASKALGGAIYGRAITLSNNGSVTFSGNKASSGSDDGDDGAFGGAIYGLLYITLSNNGSVTFSGNTASASSSFSSYSDAFGGAIYGDVGSTIMLNNNGSVVFEGNTASCTTLETYGGAIYGNSSTITLSNNGSVVFEGNTSSYDGGAIVAWDNCILTLSDNGSVVFEGNTASGFGGAIETWYNGTITLSNNDSVEFIGNTASTSSPTPSFPTPSFAHGGAIYGYSGTITLSDNGSVVFEGNTASSTSTDASGGAIYSDHSIITLSDNGSVVFSGNSVSSTSSGAHGDYARGGAISGYTITLSNNGSVTFSGNKASSSVLRVYGGAIYGGWGDITLSNNGSVMFIGNSASGDYARGGAIYAERALHIRNNDSVEFAGNVEKKGGAYRLRSVYVEGGSGDVLNISAAAGKTVSFHDSIYVGSDATVNLNADYEDAEGNIIKQKGDIVFTGATTEDDLYKAKDNVAGTEEEIRLSRTSEVLCMANLYNGRLIIKEGAIWSGAGITVDPVAGATGKPTLLLQNGTLTHDASSVTNRNVVTIKSGGAFEVAGKSQADYTSLVLEGGSSWIFNIGSDNTAADSAVLSMENSSLTLPGSGKVTLQLNAATGVGNGKSYALLSGIEQPTDWSADSITVISGTTGWNVGFSDLTWADNTLWLYYDARPDLETATWTNESGDGKWNTTSVNWEQNEIDYEYKNGVAVVFDGQGAGTVELVGELAPGSVLVNNAAGQDYTFGGSGSLTGNMKLTKKGAGNLTISTANSYTGGTVVNGGSLLAGHDKAFGTGDVAVHGATLDLNRHTIANKVRLNGNSTLGYADGASHIMLGGGSKVNFRDGFTLSSGKVLDVAAGGATYTGALTLGGGSLELDGKLTVEGAVTFESGTQTTLDISGWNGAGDGEVLATLGSSNSGYTEDSLKLSGIAGDWELDFDAATGVLTLVAVKDEPLPEPEFRPNLDRNQQAVYDTVKDIMGAGNPGGVLGLLGQEVAGSRDEAALKRVLDELSGREYATIMSSQMEGNLGHLRRLRSAAGKGTPLGEYVTMPAATSLSNKGVDKSGKGATVMMAPSPVVDSRRIRAGIAVFHEQGELDADRNGDGFERSETGAQLTMEYLVSNEFIMGMGISQSRTRLTPDYGKRQDEDNTHFDLYGVYQSGSWSSTTSLGVGLHQHELGRTVAGMQTVAEADGFSVNFLQELAYTAWADEEQGVQVFAAVESSFNKVDGFTEKGAGNASLQIENQDAWVTDVTLGLRYNRALPALSKAAPGTLSLQGGVVASLGDVEQSATMSFTGAPGYRFKQHGAERERWGYSVGASVNLPVSADVAVYGTAEAVLSNDAYTVDAQLGLKMAF